VKLLIVFFITLPFLKVFSFIKLLSVKMNNVDIRKMSLNLKYDFRNARESDIPSIAELCAETFDGPFQWHQMIQRKQSIDMYTKQLKERIEFVQNEGKHAMVVATLESDKVEVIGFIEVGMLPYPIKKESIMRSEVEKEEIEEVKDKGTEEVNEPKLLVPYLGNVAVEKSHRRLKIGSKLVKIGMKVANKWREKCCLVSVERSNEAALALYRKLGFELLLDEALLISRGSRSGTTRVFLEKVFES
jgi:ribosomal protein S18 acetylase RimI-like enzyme